MVAHIIAKAVWQGIQPHVGKAAERTESKGNGAAPRPTTR